MISSYTAAQERSSTAATAARERSSKAVSATSAGGRFGNNSAKTSQPTLFTITVNDSEGIRCVKTSQSTSNSCGEETTSIKGKTSQDHAIEVETVDSMI
eukprot:3788976-Ditylum_brightwellii.AAC.1